MDRIPELIERYNSEFLGPGEPPMTQRRLAELLSTSEAQVSRHVNGHTRMSLDTARRYAEILHCRVDDLFSDAA
ncbi:MAG: helix-turn-helix domain-containing protein [Actinobacteria bacterium]|nr:helix-turn-helix domain-containing protein [Actinomycetota bacterium]